MIANLLSAFAAFSLEVFLMGAGTVLGIVSSAARILGGITSHSEVMQRRVVASIRAGGDMMKYRHWRALRTLGVVCVEDMSISRKSIKMVIFAVFAFVTIKEKREGETQIVSFLSGVFPVSFMIVISSLDLFL